MHVAGDVAADVAGSPQCGPARPMLRRALQLTEAIAAADHRLGELVRAAKEHWHDMCSVPAPLQPALPLFAAEAGRVYLAQATKDNAAELSNLPANERRFGSWLID